MTNRILVLLGVFILCAAAASAASITLDFNGFPCQAGGQVTGPGLENPVPIPVGAKQLALQNLQAGQTYGVDFFHDSQPNPGQGSADFDFVVAADDKGIASVGLGGGLYPMVDRFQAGDRILKLKTFVITFNANGGQTGPYYISGLTAQLPQGSGPQQLTVVPGNYQVDYLYNASTDYAFIINAEGKPLPAELTPPDGTPVAVAFTNSQEYAEINGQTINPRNVCVHFKVEAPAAAAQNNPTHPVTNVVANADSMELDMTMPVGIGGGLNLWAFGTNTVSGGTVVNPDGKPAIGTKSANDYIFTPLLRYNLAKQQFYFVTTDGPSQTVTGEAEGLADDGITPLKAKVTAVIRPAATAKPAAKE